VVTGNLVAGHAAAAFRKTNLGVRINQVRRGALPENALCRNHEAAHRRRRGEPDGAGNR
jgi:hypothetical protein